MTADTTPPIATLLIKSICRRAAGVDREIFDQLPKADQRPYLKMGLVLLLISLSLALGIYALYLSFFPKQIGWSVFVTSFSFFGSFFLLRIAGRRLLEKFDAEIRYYFILTDIFFSALLGLCLLFTGFSRQRLNEEGKKQEVYARLDSLGARLRSYDSTVHADTNLIVVKGLSATDYTFNWGKRIGPLLSTINAFRETAEANSSLTAEKSNTGYSAEIKKLSAVQGMVGIFHVVPEDSLHSILYQSVPRILSYFAVPDFNQFSLQEKAARLSGYSNPLAFVYCFAGILWTLLLFAMVSSIINSNKNDFYHQLLEERKRALSENLTMERQKIVESFRIHSELQNLQRQVSIPDLPANALTDELKQGLTPASLMAAARLQYDQQNLEKALEYVNKAIELDDQSSDKDKNHRIRPDTYELKAQVLKDMKLFDDAERAEKQAIEIRNENAFLDNRGKTILLDKLALNNVSIFDNCIWNFQPGINILLGKNGFGKSHLFGLIVALLYDDKKKVRDWVNGSRTDINASLYLKGQVPGQELEDKIAEKAKTIKEMQERINKEAMESKLAEDDVQLRYQELDKQFETQVAEMEKLNSEIIQLQKELSGFRPSISVDINTIKSQTGRLPVLAIPDARFLTKSNDTIRTSPGQRSDLARGGATEFLYGESFSAVIENTFFKIAIDYFKGATNFDAEPFMLIKRVLKDLSADRLITVDGKEVYQDLSRFRFETIDLDEKTGTFSIKVRPEDADIVLPIQRISQGTLSIVAICCLIYNFLQSIYGKVSDLTERAAIVIVDEIDAHIHPSWQRKLIGIMRENFPGVQFIISAHSPLLIEGCKANEVSVLRRTAEGRFRIDTIPSGMVGLTIENIYSLVFEIENKDFTIRRYKELAPYQDNFKKELETLLQKSQPSDAEIKRMKELKDYIENIDASTRSFEKLQNERAEEFNNISAFLRTAAQSSPSNLQ